MIEWIKQIKIQIGSEIESVKDKKTIPESESSGVLLGCFYVPRYLDLLQLLHFLSTNKTTY